MHHAYNNNQILQNNLFYLAILIIMFKNALCDKTTRVQGTTPLAESKGQRPWRGLGAVPQVAVPLAS